MSRHCSQRWVAAALALLALACASAPRNPVLDKYPAGIDGRTTVLYYDVRGSTYAELRADMRAKGPKLDGTSFVGETRSPMGWRWKTESMGGMSCRIREVSVAVNARITLPRWTPPADTEPGLVAEWHRFLTALEVHEAGHKDISAKAGKEIIDQVRGLSGICAQINTRANDIARSIVERSSREQIAYDATTRHGITQGTSFGSGRYNTSTLNFGSEPLTLLVGPRPGTVRGPLPVSVEQAWAALPAAYASVELSINARDSSAHVVGDSMTVRGMLGALPVSAFVDCGAPPSGRNADSVSVSLFVTSRLEGGEASGSTVTNTVQAVGRPAGASVIGCRSRGVIERRLLEALRQAVVR